MFTYVNLPEQRPFNVIVERKTTMLRQTEVGRRTAVWGSAGMDVEQCR
jgi:hypothetical protein